MIRVRFLHPLLTDRRWSHALHWTLAIINTCIALTYLTRSCCVIFGFYVPFIYLQKYENNSSLYAGVGRQRGARSLLFNNGPASHLEFWLHLWSRWQQQCVLKLRSQIDQ